jgi:hypothetical protein
LSNKKETIKKPECVVYVRCFYISTYFDKTKVCKKDDKTVDIFWGMG